MSLAGAPTRRKVGALMRTRWLVVLVIATGFVAAACADSRATDGSAEVAGLVTPLDAQLIERGRQLYSANCASCHGATGEGQPNWKQRGPDGALPAPPQDETGHTWHHADGLLFRIVAEGCATYGGDASCRMPAFGDTLSSEDIEAVIEHLRSWWGPDERAFQQQVSENDPLPSR